MPRATIKDIALAAKVSPMTVSNVINGRAGKGLDRDDRAHQRGDRAGSATRPTCRARALVSNASRMVGVLIPFTENQNALLLDNPFYAEIVSGIETALRAEGYYMMLSGVGERDAKLDILSSWSMDALIVLGVYKEALYEQLKARDLPTLLIDSYIDDDHFYRLGIDDEQAAFDATRYLIAQGHRDIAVVTGVIRTDGVVERRVAGYRRALKAAGIAPDPALVLSGSVTFDWGGEAAARDCRQSADHRRLLHRRPHRRRRPRWASPARQAHPRGRFGNGLRQSLDLDHGLSRADDSRSVDREQGAARRQPHRLHPQQDAPRRGETFVPTTIVERDSVRRRGLMDGVTGRGKCIALAVLLRPESDRHERVLHPAGRLVVRPELQQVGPADADRVDRHRQLSSRHSPIPAVQQALRNTLLFILGYLPVSRRHRARSRAAAQPQAQGPHDLPRHLLRAGGDLVGRGVAGLEVAAQSAIRARQLRPRR